MRYLYCVLYISASNRTSNCSSEPIRVIQEDPMEHRKAIVLLNYILLLTHQPHGVLPREYGYQTNALWLEWKRQHAKSYDDHLSELERYVTWVSNKALIDSHNSLASSFGYSLALNQYADLVSVRIAKYI